MQRRSALVQSILYAVACCHCETCPLYPRQHHNGISSLHFGSSQDVYSRRHGTACGLRWTEGANDGSLGVGEQMAVMEIIQSNLVDKVPAWRSEVEGTGTSKGDADAGPSNTADSERLSGSVVTTADRLGAGILTALILIGVVGGSAVMCLSE